MSETISQRELRNENAAIMRRVEAGESFVVTRNGVPVADIVPHQVRPRPRTLAELQQAFQDLPPMDSERWHAERQADDAVFGPDDPFETLAETPRR
ncbi:MAG: type II toxin-antitoxin system Phd/YefM family antitoxin [Angustibacter sp.]